VEKIAEFPVGVSGDFVTNKVRSTYGVVNVLSHLLLIERLHYYFRDFSVAANLPQGSRDFTL
jgi:hypothetical protein